LTKGRAQSYLQRGPTSLHHKQRREYHYINIRGGNREVYIDKHKLLANRISIGPHKPQKNTKISLKNGFYVINQFLD